MSKGKTISKMTKEEQEKLYKAYSIKARFNLDFLVALSVFLKMDNTKQIIEFNSELSKILHPEDYR